MLSLITARTASPSSVPSRVAVRARLALARRWSPDDRDTGMTTAEYAVGTVAACGFGGVLYKVITSEQVLDLLKAVISKAFHFSF